MAATPGRRASVPAFVVAGPDGEPTAQTCPHVSQVRHVVPSTTMGCEDCLREGTGWVHLRLCLTCGHVGRCDSSPRRHARAHWHRPGHAIVPQSDPAEDRACGFAAEGLLL